MIQVRHESCTEKSTCEGCGKSALPVEIGMAWFCVYFAMLATHELKRLWFCIECGTDLGTLLLRDHLINR